MTMENEGFDGLRDLLRCYPLDSYPPNPYARDFDITVSSTPAFPWKPLGVNASAFLRITTPSSPNSAGLSCRSFITAVPDWNGDYHIYQYPMVHPTVPIHHTVIKDMRGCRPKFSQLHPRKSLIAAYCEESDMAKTLSHNGLISGYTSLESIDRQREKIDTLITLDIGQVVSSISRYRIRVPWTHQYSSCVLDDEGVLRILYFDHLSETGGRVSVHVYECTLSSATVDGTLSIRAVDSQSWSVSDVQQQRFCVNLFKAIGQSYFVWFLELLEKPRSPYAARFSEKTGYFCVSCRLSPGGIWEWTETPMPFQEWARTEGGLRLWSAAQAVNEIEYDIDSISLLRKVDVMPEAGMVIAKTTYGVFSRFAYRVPSLQTLAADVVREMVEFEVKETKSLSIWNWWTQLTGAANLFGPCLPGFWGIEVKAADLQLE